MITKELFYAWLASKITDKWKGHGPLTYEQRPIITEIWETHEKEPEIALVKTFDKFEKWGVDLTKADFSEYIKNRQGKKEEKEEKEEGPKSRLAFWKRKKKPEKDDFIIKPCVYLDGVLYDTVATLNNGQPLGTRYGYLKNGKFQITEKVISRETKVEYRPPKGEEIRKNVVLLPTTAEEYGSTNELIKEIRAFLKANLDISETSLELIPYWVLAASVYEQLSTINYLRFLGDYGTGKSRGLDTVGHIIPRSIVAAGASTVAALFRICDKWKGSVLMDESDFKFSDETQEIIKFLNLGFEAGKSIIKCHQQDATKLSFFDAYCPKIIATRRRFQDKATESRCITEVMTVTDKENIPVVLTKPFFDAAQKLRNKVFKWRLDNWDTIAMASNLNTEAKDYINPVAGLKGIEPRLKQMSWSISIILQSHPEANKKFKEFIKLYQQDLISDRQQTWEGQVFLILIEILNEKEHIRSKDIADKLGEKFTPAKVGRILRTLGFKIKQARVEGKVKRVIEIDYKLLVKLCGRFGVPDVPDVPHVTDAGGSSQKKGHLNNKQKSEASNTTGTSGTSGTEKEVLKSYQLCALPCKECKIKDKEIYMHQTGPLCRLCLLHYEMKVRK